MWYTTHGNGEKGCLAWLGYVRGAGGKIFWLTALGFGISGAVLLS